MDNRHKSNRVSHESYNRLEYHEETVTDEHPLYAEEEKQHVTVSSMRPDSSGNQFKLLVISLTVVAVILLGVDIGLGVYYGKLAGGYLVTDINGELAKLRKAYDQAVREQLEAQTQLLKEVDNHKKSKYNLKIEQRTISDLQEDLGKIQSAVAKLKSDLILKEEGCRHCMAGWTFIGSKCFHFSYLTSHSPSSWHAARQFCKSLNADLAIINSRDKQFVTTEIVSQINKPIQSSSLYVSRYHNGYWIGLTDLDEEGVWTWVDGTRLTEGYWDAGEPNNQGNEDCAAVYFTNDLGRSWNDAPCEFKLRWICEMQPRLTG